MQKLANVSADELRAHLADVEEAKGAKRLMVALAYTDGVPVETISERYGIPRSTIYYWLDRFESRSITSALDDEERPGRPRRLGDRDLRSVRTALRHPPTDYGIDAEDWTPELVQRHVEDEYGVSYSIGHVRRLVDELTDE